jgi:hypothetical protein
MKPFVDRDRAGFELGGLFRKSPACSVVLFGAISCGLLVASSPCGAATIATSGSARHSVTVAEGRRDTANGYCSSQACRDIVVTIKHFVPHTKYEIEFSTNCQTGNATTKAECEGGPNPGSSDYAIARVTTNDTGGYVGRPRAFGWSGATVWVTVSGVRSNTVVWR